jgi:hypothetical protein
MPHAEEFKHIQVQELHPTFGAEIKGVDFSKPVSDEVFAEILAAITKVGHLHSTLTSELTPMCTVWCLHVPQDRIRRCETCRLRPPLW